MREMANTRFSNLRREPPPITPSWVYTDAPLPRRPHRPSAGIAAIAWARWRPLTLHAIVVEVVSR